MTVCLSCSWDEDESLNDLSKIGTSRASAGSVTSATNVTEESDLIQFGTFCGLASVSVIKSNGVDESGLQQVCWGLLHDLVDELQGSHLRLPFGAGLEVFQQHREQNRRVCLNRKHAKKRVDRRLSGPFDGVFLIGQEVKSGSKQVNKVGLERSLSCELSGQSLQQNHAGLSNQCWVLLFRQGQQNLLDVPLGNGAGTRVGNHVGNLVAVVSDLRQLGCCLQVIKDVRDGGDLQFLERGIERRQRRRGLHGSGLWGVEARRHLRHVRV
ncbi:hypothetical protein OGAPHI_003342 [Ogataea philodendri]|uniref:Uncharacterized protein n=1 Tax=Ogataea philodendri TaxID=1378263 RepID=A0A9P8P7U3_9ASCO|nr:uncharacterized protein OGAPHI_003342 [Ogataea philodendri]KAH3666892.1 hypothetical protein OGAPHI_003342 [Ogataea philodendri]